MTNHGMMLPAWKEQPHIITVQTCEILESIGNTKESFGKVEIFLNHTVAINSNTTAIISLKQFITDM